MVSRRRRGEAALARRADHNAGGRQCLLVSYIPLGFSSEPRPVLRQNCNAKDHARAHNSQNTSRPHIEKPVAPRQRCVPFCYYALRRSAPHLWPSRRGRGSQRPTTRTPAIEATRASASLQNIKLQSTTPTVRAGRRRPVLRGRPRQRHRLQEGRVGPRDAGRTTRAEGEI